MLKNAIAQSEDIDTHSATESPLSHGKGQLYPSIPVAEIVFSAGVENLIDCRKKTEPEDDLTLIVIKVKENVHPDHR